MKKRFTVVAILMITMLLVCIGCSDPSNSGSSSPASSSTGTSSSGSTPTSSSSGTTSSTSGGSGASSAASGGTTTTTTTGLPASVGTDPFKGNTYQNSATKYVFKMDGTYEYWSSSNNQWVLQSEKEYTYNANTKIMSYKSKKVRNGMSGSLLTQAEFLEWINGLPDNSEMFQTGITRAQMCDYVNALYNAIGYCKCEEETYQGSLCYSSRDYYP